MKYFIFLFSLIYSKALLHVLVARIPHLFYSILSLLGQEIKTQYQEARLCLLHGFK